MRTATDAVLLRPHTTLLRGCCPRIGTCDYGSARSGPVVQAGARCRSLGSFATP